MRLDVYLSEQKIVATRNVAKNLIELGKVLVNGKAILKPAYFVDPTDEITVTDIYDASLGSIKLEKAFDTFPITVQNKTCVDLGAANGGFCAILLKNGAKKIYALDIGECALTAALLNDQRIIPMPETNARFISEANFNDSIDFITCDVSFISLKLILPAAYRSLAPNGEGIFLIKPQFETDKKHLPKSGILHDAKQRAEIVSEIEHFAHKIGFIVKGCVEAPHPFANKNQEYLLYLCKNNAL